MKVGVVRRTDQTGDLRVDALLLFGSLCLGFRLGEGDDRPDLPGCLIDDNISALAVDRARRRKYGADFLLHLHLRQVRCSQDVLRAILLGNGDGTFQIPANYAEGSFSGPLALGDFNGDGAPDLVVSDGSNVNILLGNGNGTYQAPVPVYTASLPGLLAVADFNRDGKADLAVMNSNGVSASAAFLFAQRRDARLPTQARQ